MIPAPAIKFVTGTGPLLVMSGSGPIPIGDPIVIAAILVDAANQGRLVMVVHHWHRDALSAITGKARLRQAVINETLAIIGPKPPFEHWQSYLNHYRKLPALESLIRTAIKAAKRARGCHHTAGAAVTRRLGKRPKKPPNPNPERRDTRWKPGVSANPGGRPAVVRELRDAAQREGLNCIQTLIKIRDNEDFPPITRIAACNSLLDRGYGRPVHGVAIQNLPALPEPQPINNSMTNEEAAHAYHLTLQQGRRDLEKLIEGEIIDVVQ